MFQANEELVDMLQTWKRIVTSEFETAHRTLSPDVKHLRQFRQESMKRATIKWCVMCLAFWHASKYASRQDGRVLDSTRTDIGCKLDKHTPACSTLIMMPAWNGKSHKAMICSQIKQGSTPILVQPPRWRAKWQFGGISEWRACKNGSAVCSGTLRNHAPWWSLSWQSCSANHDTH